MKFFNFTLLMVLALSVQAQVTKNITGKVINNKNDVVVKATIYVNGVSRTTTDGDGLYALSLAKGKYVIKVTSTGYSPWQSDTIVVAGAADSKVIDVILIPQSKVEESAVVRGQSRPQRESTNATISLMKNSNAVSSVISREAILRSPDPNTGEVLKRTSGASIQEGKFVVIRGLADRYNQAVLNGILLTSTEPDRKTFSYNLIPSNVIDNLVINKAFIPELPGEWAGGLVIVNTRDIPSKNYFNVQVSSGYNTVTTGRQFLIDRAGKWEAFGIEDGTRGLPSSYISKAKFDTMSIGNKTLMGKQLRNAWQAESMTAPLNMGVQLNGAFAGKIFGKKSGIMFGIQYNKSQRFLDMQNRLNTLTAGNFSINSDLNDRRYQQEVQLGALVGATLQLNDLNKISFKSLFNINTSNATTQRLGYDITRNEDLKGSEFTFKQNTFYTSQLVGEHTLKSNMKLKWYGAFNILDGYQPDQRRILYSRDLNSSNPYRLVLSSTLSQQSGSRIYQNLNDYIYTAGGDYTYTLKNKQTVKAGYMFQVRDRLYDAKLFANFLPTDNDGLRLIDQKNVFNPENFGSGLDNKFAFNAIKGNNFRYMANTILNAAYLQADNEIADKFRVIYGVRMEHFDQLVGSQKRWDPRHSHNVVLDLLPGISSIYKVNSKTNIRLSASQTVIRPELRELASLNLYDFELNASVQGNPTLKRTKITNLDLRYELYKKPGEVLSIGSFYKNFSNAIEQIFNEGIGGASTFNYQNAKNATSLGVEVEFRKKLTNINALKNFTVQGNASYIKSQVTDKQFNIDRPLQGQSPYLINAGLMYDLSKLGITSTLLFNRIGERIFLVGDITSGAGSPDIYEAPRSILDFQITKKVLKTKGEFKLNISDILNQTQYFYQNKVDGKKSFQKNDDALRFTRRFGTIFNLSFNYNIL